MMKFQDLETSLLFFLLYFLLWCIVAVTLFSLCGGGGGGSWHSLTRKSSWGPYQSPFRHRIAIELVLKR
jgi:hypothetical protein